MTTKIHWRRTQVVYPDAPDIRREDWTLSGLDGRPLARVFDTERPNILGSWRWQVAPFYVTMNHGAALTGTDARMKCEKRLE